MLSRRPRGFGCPGKMQLATRFGLARRQAQSNRESAVALTGARRCNRRTGSTARSCPRAGCAPRRTPRPPRQAPSAGSPCASARRVTRCKIELGRRVVRRTGCLGCCGRAESPSRCRPRQTAARSSPAATHRQAHSSRTVASIASAHLRGAQRPAAAQGVGDRLEHRLEPARDSRTNQPGKLDVQEEACGWRTAAWSYGRPEWLRWRSRCPAWRRWSRARWVRTTSRSSA